MDEQKLMSTAMRVCKHPKKGNFPSREHLIPRKCDITIRSDCIPRSMVTFFFALFCRSDEHSKKQTNHTHKK
jgi:hypothetical protein